MLICLDPEGTAVPKWQPLHSMGAVAVFLEEENVCPVPPGKASARKMGLIKSLPSLLPAEIEAAPCWAAQPDVGIQDLAVEGAPSPTTPASLSLPRPIPALPATLTGLTGASAAGVPAGHTTSAEAWPHCGRHLLSEYCKCALHLYNTQSQWYEHTAIRPIGLCP